mmetsp:Transcript_33089/g.48495  ORF Transcript_33089/g.48495 Transcript_33089/m.48495 type:complete len:106 (+) Transcript_33089:1327-1644(+)
MPKRLRTATDTVMVGNPATATGIATAQLLSTDTAMVQLLRTDTATAVNRVTDTGTGTETLNRHRRLMFRKLQLQLKHMGTAMVEYLATATATHTESNKHVFSLPF